ncbi:MAG: response regulator [Lacunisphaera sp.]|nr:response regulator [Lacunisphaera sp.]
MPSTRSPRRSWLPYGYLLPFAMLVLAGLVVGWGWVAGQVNLVQPRSYDAALPANACACLVLIGLTPFALTFGWKWNRFGLVLAGAVTLLAWATLIQGPLNLDFGLDDLLVNHRALVAGEHIGRMPALLALVFMLTGAALLWLALRPSHRHRPVLIALLGSLAGAYGLTALLAYRTGLNSVPLWQDYANLGPHTALLLIVLGAGLTGLAAHDSRTGQAAAPRWLWLPVVVCCVTVTVTFWVALRQRELDYTNSTTQLRINNVAALFSGEAEARIESFVRTAKRWSRTPGVTQAAWEGEAAEFLQDFEGYSSVQWVDAGWRTRWHWPHPGNEDIPLYDHAGQPLRAAAISAAGPSTPYTIAAPIESPLLAPTFAVYVPVLRGTSVQGFLVGEFYYEKFFDIVDRRLNLSRRYQLSVAIDNPSATDPAARQLKVYEAMTPDETLDRRLHQSAVYNLLNQRMTITLVPRPALLGADRQFLAELALFSGLGVSVLLGLVINLAQSAYLRQRAAERTAAQLREENEERRRVEARLQAADERLTLALDSTQLGVYEWHVETDSVFCTPSVWKIIGYDPAEMPTTGAGWLGLLHVDDQPAVRAVIDAHFRGETPFIEIEHCIVHQNGDALWVALRAKCTSFSAARRPLRVLGTIQNINARKRADEALRASQAASRKLSLVASKTDNAVIITDDHGRIEWVNESYSRLTGRRLAAVSGQPLTAQLAGPDGDPDAVDRINTALFEREPVTLDAVQLATDDRRFYVHLDVQPVINDEGLVENFIAIETDITARVETEQSLRRAKADADDASRAKSEFLASMSHEIRTPMNGVIGMTSLLLETDLTAEQRDYVSTIRTSGDSLLSIINEILDFSKIESGRMEMESQPFELAQCIEEAVDLFALQAAAKDIELAFHIESSVPRVVLGDITRLRQVLVNLMNNAVKFTPRGFITLEITATTRPPAPGHEANVVLNFYITDTGIGIPADRLGLLFKPFSQVDASTTRRYGGTGLGLAICDRLCQLMGGGITVASTPGSGSRFHFNILTSAVNVTDADTPAMFPPLPRGTVLAVDDHPVNRTMLYDCLSQWQLKSRIASSAAEARKLADAGRLAAAIIDQVLPDASGLELVTELRTRFPTLPIVLLTPAGESASRSAHPDPLLFRLPKPIKPYALYDTLRHVIVGPAPEGSATPMAADPIVRLADTIPLDILLVEDNPVNQKVALRYLERMGYRADAVANGLEGVQAVQSRPYHLVFMDMQMPEMDGLQATREIRVKLSKDRQPVIIALTANAMQGDRERCLESGMDDYITKPVKIDEIQAKISHYFGPKK